MRWTLQINQRSFVFVFAMLIAAMLSAGSGRLWAQGATATILGTVTDMSGAAVPRAMVQVKNSGTGVTQSIATDAQGRFESRI
jgi:Carboxypeptidase regulatory-like domain